MKRIVAFVMAALWTAAVGGGASAETIDAKTFSCKELTAAMASKDKDDQYGASVILYWIHGYLRTEEQGTVVDFKHMVKAFEETAAFCSENPNIGVLTASQKFMGENEPEAGKEAIDLAIIKCEKVIDSDEDDAQGLGQILMWLSGYHAGDDEETVIDFDRFESDSKDIGSYCSEHQQVGFYTASEKVMASDASEDEDDETSQE